MEVTKGKVAAGARPLLLLALAVAASAWPQTTLSTGATEPWRFIAAHGERSAIFGYAGRSLEIWGYPVQILDRYTVDFEPQGSSTILDGADLLTRVEVAPDAIVRTWTGPNFQVRETEFVPLDEPAAILRYEVMGASPTIVIRYRPVMDLMWPASAGGQDIHWDDQAHGYVLSESTWHYQAVLASQQIDEHPPIVNSTHREDLTQTFTLHPDPQPGGTARAAVYIALMPPGESHPEATIRHVMDQEPEWRRQYPDRLRNWKAEALSITTPDPEINSALAWADTDLEQAWACDDKIGCGVVAGYGPSRPMRRPQYDWFFAGDGMVASEALLAAGHLRRAREELEFVLRYQNPSNGMIWHEIAQSAGFLDWAGKYPYLYPHVDLTFQFLSTLGDYYAATGDLQFLTSHWSSIAAAFHFCRSLIAADTGMPVIPANQLGADEQDRLREDAGLSAAWVGAASAYARMARATAHPSDADAADEMAQRARAAWAHRYWNDAERFWISGYTVSGNAMNLRRSGPTAALAQHLLSPAQENEMLGTLAGAAFQTDWGTRSLATDSPQYDPNSYSKGSVSALHTAETAEAFWSAHRPVAAWQMWSGLVPWAHLDSLGHMDEVLTGNVFTSQVESVPEQTWSSAGFLSAAIRGLLGITMDAPANHLTLAPHHVPGGGTVTLANLHAAGAVVSATIEQQEQSIEVALKNDGQPIRLSLVQEMPLGASRLRARVNGKSVPVTLHSWDQEQQAGIELLLPNGLTQCRFEYAGGVWIEVPRADLEPGATSTLPRIREVSLHGAVLQIDADARQGAESSLILETPWVIASVEGGTAHPLSAARTRIVFAPGPASGESSHYVATWLRIRLRSNR